MNRQTNSQSTESTTDFNGIYTAINDNQQTTQSVNCSGEIRPWTIPNTQTREIEESVFMQYFGKNQDEVKSPEPPPLPKSTEKPFEPPNHPAFVELSLLSSGGNELEWREIARWIKFEEDVEVGGNRWSKPHVGTLSLQSINSLKALLGNGSVMLEVDVLSLEALTNIICLNMVNIGVLSKELRGKVHFLLQRPHCHQHDLSKRSSLKIDFSNSKSKQKADIILTANTLNMAYRESNELPPNNRIIKKIPKGAEASNILVGEVEFLDKPLSVFVRLKEAAILQNFNEVKIPNRFIYLLLCPKGMFDCKEIGRAMATLMSDDNFRKYAYAACEPEHFITGIEEFLSAVTVLPPGKWNPSIRIEPPPTLVEEENPKNPPDLPVNVSNTDVVDSDEQQLEETGLVRTGRLFGGLVNDIKRKAPWYWSDFRDALNMQCIASWIFLYFACLSPIITFGGLLSEATGRNIAAIESLVSGFICGVVYGLFCGQPLAILGSTGPVLVFESIVYEYCQSHGWDYLTLRFWIGTWIAVILLLLTAFDASATVCYITRFTEENFATLIAFIFIYKAVENVITIGKNFPINPPIFDCICTPPLGSNATILDYAKYERSYCRSLNGTLVGKDCNKPETVNVFLMSIILFLGTFLISVILKEFKNAFFFPTCVRQFISDFAVIIGILTMSTLDYFLNVGTTKLEVPTALKPTLPTRGWLIPPFHEKNPTWTIFGAIIPALLGTILIFMDQQITAVIINRKENKLLKGCGYHLDLFILAILIQICTIMGLPWFVAATVLSLNHVNSLKQESECSAPGEKPQFLGIREQRVTQLLIFITMGLSVVLTPLLRHIPMPVLFGVFLYMGVTSLRGLQFYDRILIMFMPAKYQPDYDYLRQVPIHRVHLFTFIQLACLIALWVIKSFSETSILFPLMLVVMIGIRKLLDYVFTQRELKILDDIMPGRIKCIKKPEEQNAKVLGEKNTSVTTSIQC